MAKKVKLNLSNDNLIWDANRRYKTNSVVQFNNVSYQNTTGKNTSPELLLDWQKVIEGVEPHASTHESTGIDPIQGENLSVNIIPPTSNYIPTTPTLKGHLQGIDTALGNVVQTTAGITSRVFYTGDLITLGTGTFYLSNYGGKGTVAGVSPTPVINDDNQKKYFAQDVISIPFDVPVVAPAGVYSGNLSVRINNDNSQQRYTIEVYRTDLDGTPLPSGVAGAPVGALGVTVLSILDSGLLNLVGGDISSINLTGYLTQEVTFNVNERLRYRVSAEKVGTTGGNITMEVFYGSNYNSFYDVPVIADTNSVLNRSTVVGTTTTNALDSLNSLKEEKANKNIPNGYAGLDSGGKINPLQLPALAITDTFVVSSQAQMLALVAEVGDVAVRTDLNKSFILRVTGASTLVNWQELLTPVSVDQTIIDGSTNAVSGNAVFDGLAGKFNTPTGLTTNYLPKWNGSGFGNSCMSDGVNGVTITGNSKGLIFDNEPLQSFGILIKESGGNIWSINKGAGDASSNYNIYSFSSSKIVASFKTTGDIDLAPQGGNVSVNGNITASPAVAPNQVPTWGQVQAFVPSDTVNLTGNQTIAGIKTFSSPPVVPNAVNANEAVNKGQLDAVGRPYKVYTALMTQTGTNVPTVVVLENTLGGTVVWSRNATGVYYGTLIGVFTVGKTGIIATPSFANVIISAVRADNNFIIIRTSTSGTLSDSGLTNVLTEIRVYN